MSRPPLGSVARALWCRDGVVELVMLYASSFQELAERLPADDPAKGRMELLSYGIDRVREAERAFVAKGMAEAEAAEAPRAQSAGSAVAHRDT